jgi:hypothetical protein
MAARLLLVHSPLTGSATWALVAADLAGRGYEVGVPDLTGAVMDGPPYCVRQAEVIARSASGEPAVFIGHSGAGPLSGGARVPAPYWSSVARHCPARRGASAAMTARCSLPLPQPRAVRSITLGCEFRVA